MIPHPGLGVLASSGSVVEYYCRVQSSSTVVESVIVVDPRSKFLHQFQECRRVRLPNICRRASSSQIPIHFQKAGESGCRVRRIPMSPPSFPPLPRPLLLSLLFPVLLFSCRILVHISNQSKKPSSQVVASQVIISSHSYLQVKMSVEFKGRR